MLEPKNLFTYNRCLNVDTLSDVSVLHFKHEINHYPRPEEERNIRDFYKITLVVKGRATLFWNQCSCPLIPGKRFFSSCEDLTSYAIETPFLEIYDVIFRESAFRELMEEGFRNFFLSGKGAAENGHGTLILNAGREIPKLIRMMHRETEEGSIHHALAGRLLLRLLFLHLERIEAESKRPGVAEEIVSLIRNTIETKFAKKLNFRLLALRAGVSPEHLNRVYRKKTGKTISEALKERRLEAAETLLRNSGMKIVEIALRSGFHDPSYFSREFQKKYRIAPGLFRQNANGLN